MKWLSRIVFGVGLLLVALYFVGGWYFSNRIIAVPTQSLPGYADEIQRLDIDWDAPPPEEIEVQSGDITLSGSYFDNPADGNCAILMLHGYTGTRYGMLTFAPFVWDYGCDLLMYDHRGHGNSSDAYHTYGFYEKEDALQMYEWLLDRTGLLASQVGLFGVSYGAATSLQMLTLRDDMAFIIADSSYQDLTAIVSHQGGAQFGSWVQLFVPGAFMVAELRADFEADEVSPLLAVAGKSTPILLTHAVGDSFTPAAHSQAIANNGQSDTIDLQITDWGADHAESHTIDPAAYQAMIDHFINSYVPGFGK